MNILESIINIYNSQSFNVTPSTGSVNNRANAMGTSFEEYMKNSFCNTFNATNVIKDTMYNRTFSYQGNSNNPPDLILKGSDAIEIKKLTSKKSSELQLNSSHPKNVLKSSSTLIKKECKNCETPSTWAQKDMVYVIGHVPKNSQLHAVWYTYGEIYCQNESAYRQFAKPIANAIYSDPNYHNHKPPTPSLELARLNDVDPLKITYLRVRGMWVIAHPYNVYNHNYDDSAKFQIHAFIPKKKYDSIDKNSRVKIETIAQKDPTFNITDDDVKNPNNPKNLIPIKYISYIQ
jgi:hypothetical protein